MPDELTEPTGPTSGLVGLPRHLDWSEQRVYDLDDPARAGLMYERVIREAASPEDLTAHLNAQILIRLWERPYLPPKVRRLWQSRFPALTRAA